MNASRRQSKPVPNASRPIWDLVIADMRARDKKGRKKYGVPLQAHNGRDALLDVYQECLDMCVYFRQMIEERGLQPEVRNWRKARSQGIDWLNPGEPRCPSVHGGQQCQWQAGHEGPHQECNEVWNHA